MQQWIANNVVPGNVRKSGLRATYHLSRVEEKYLAPHKLAGGTLVVLDGGKGARECRSLLHEDDTMNSPLIYV